MGKRKEQINAVLAGEVVDLLTDESMARVQVQGYDDSRVVIFVGTGAELGNNVFAPADLRELAKFCNKLANELEALWVK